MKKQGAPAQIILLKPKINLAQDRIDRLNFALAHTPQDFRTKFLNVFRGNSFVMQDPQAILFLTENIERAIGKNKFDNPNGEPEIVFRVFCDDGDGCISIASMLSDGSIECELNPKMPEEEIEAAPQRPEFAGILFDIMESNLRDHNQSVEDLIKHYNNITEL